MNSQTKEIIEFLDAYLTKTKRSDIDPVEANAILANAGLLNDNAAHPGLPLRKLLRKGKLAHAFQSGGKGTSWIIPHSGKQTKVKSNYSTSPDSVKKFLSNKNKQNISTPVNIIELKKQLKKARLKFKPDKVKYLLVAEAPPDSIDRFFYYENVKKKDYLFLGIAEALYPDLKDEYILYRPNSETKRTEIKNIILLKLKEDGFYLLDLSELPLSLMNGNLNSQLPIFTKKLKKVIAKQTKIILIKTTVYDTAFNYLQNQGNKNVIDVRIPFPDYHWQKVFQIKFKEALKFAKYL